MICLVFGLELLPYKGYSIENILNTIEIYSANRNTVVHIGAYSGNEISGYINAGFSKLILVEADPYNYHLLELKADEFRNEDVDILIRNTLIADQDGEDYKFYRFFGEGSGSLSSFIKVLICLQKDGKVTSKKLLNLNEKD